MSGRSDGNADVCLFEQTVQQEPGCHVFICIALHIVCNHYEVPTHRLPPCIPICVKQSLNPGPWTAVPVGATATPPSENRSFHLYLFSGWVQKEELLMTLCCIRSAKDGKIFIIPHLLLRFQAVRQCQALFQGSEDSSVYAFHFQT